MAEGERIIKVNIEEEMKTAYIDYSMSVIVSRALPDVRDGLKPVHRRVLFGMSELGILSNKGYKKSARIVGEVLGKYHPHGDSSVYEAMVRMAQPWSMRYMLVDGQGNFGSVDGDGPAAMRYTEARLQKISEETLRDLDKDTVDFQLNFDDSLKEPTVLPTRVPILLVNGASGIAVGMATNMPPHNLSDTIDAVKRYVDDREVTIEDLTKIIKAPDFPTGGIIYGYQGVKEAYESGRGRVVLRGKANIETTPSGKEQIIVNEIPYQVNKAELIKRTAELVNEKKIEGISNINDESDRNGMRIVYDLKRDAIANVVLNKLYKYTQLQTSFSVNNIALVKGRPKLLNLKQIISNFVEHRHEVVIRRTQYELNQAEKKAHILEGLLIALDNLDEVISLIRASKTPEEAKQGLISNFQLSEEQAKAILEMRLQKLTGLERDKIKLDYEELQKLIAHLKEVLGDESIRMNIIKEELDDLKEHFGDERKTEIQLDAEEFNPEDFYADEDVLITISHMGYIKRMSLNEFRTQHRGGVGARGGRTRDNDFLEHMFIANMHNTLMLFTEKGKCFWLKVYEIPEGSKNSKGRAVQNLINIEPEDNIKAFINAESLKDEEYIDQNYILMCTKKGMVKKTKLEAYSRPRTNGVNAITIKEGDQLLEAKLTDGDSDIILATREGKAIRFNEKDVRAIGRTGSGVRGITLGGNDDEVIGMVWIEQGDNEILVVSEKGFGKRSGVDEYRTINRGGKGVKTFGISDKTGLLVGIKGVSDEVDLMIITRNGVTIRVDVADIRVTGRATQGVRLINLKKNDTIAAVTQVSKTDDEEAEPLPEDESAEHEAETNENPEAGEETATNGEE